MHEIIEQIRSRHRERCFMMEQRKRMDLALASFLRIHLGWRPDLDEKERGRIAKDALLLMKSKNVKIKMADGVHEILLPTVNEDHPLYALIAASLAARAPFEQAEKKNTKEMERLASQLPVWEWAQGIRGFGVRSLAVIVGEAGDLANYPKKGHLWKRMGVAVIDGVRQGGLPKTASAEEWIEHAYNRKRRAQMFVIGDCLVKQGEEYRAIYLARKAIERERAEERGLQVVPAAKIPKKNAHLYVSDGHVHRRAQRYMEKVLLRDLWQAWRGKKERDGEFVGPGRSCREAARPMPDMSIAA